jgi:hypothetical protein
VKAMHWTLCLLAISAGVVLLCVPVGFSTPVEDVPEPCVENTTTMEQYAVGYNFGGYAVDQAWMSIKADCNQLPTFAADIRRIFNNLLLPPDPSISFTCRYAGIFNGGIEKLHELWPNCEELCTMDGQMVGELVGQLYCSLSSAFGGLDLAATTYCRPPTSWCSELAQTACEESYASFTPTYVDLLGVACAPFTQPPYNQPPPEFDPPLMGGVWGQFGFNGCTEPPLAP